MHSTEDFSRMWFAVCADSTLFVLGDHGDYAAADATANDLGLDVMFLVCGADAAQWADTINAKRSLHINFAGGEYQ